jgi:hypothetical protein
MIAKMQKKRNKIPPIPTEFGSAQTTAVMIFFKDLSLGTIHRTCTIRKLRAACIGIALKERIHDVKTRNKSNEA